MKIDTFKRKLGGARGVIVKKQDLTPSGTRHGQLYLIKANTTGG